MPPVIDVRNPDAQIRVKREPRRIHIQLDSCHIRIEPYPAQIEHGIRREKSGMEMDIDAGRQMP
jgi:hypothetical protein